jgi:hypothetical protein
LFENESMRFFKSNPNASQSNLALTFHDLIAKLVAIWICDLVFSGRRGDEFALCVGEWKGILTNQVSIAVGFTSRSRLGAPSGRLCQTDSSERQDASG